MRLGQTDVDVVNSQRYRVKQGQALLLLYTSNAVAQVRAWARVRYDNGEDDILFIPDQAMGSDRVVTISRPSDVARYDGWVTDALIELPIATDAVKRGQAYVRLSLDPFGPLLCCDYCYSNLGQVALGTYIQDGPGGGAGNLQVVTIKILTQSVATTTHTLAASNTVRKILSFAWYYSCDSGVASRLLDVDLRNPLGDGLASLIADVWRATRLTLTASQQGTIFLDSKRSGTNDNGTLVIDDGAANPSPFPLWIEENDPENLRFVLTDLESGDLDEIYLLQEEWVVGL